MSLLPLAFPRAFHKKTTKVLLTKVLGVTSSSLTPVSPPTPEINDPTKDIKLQGPTAGAFCTNTVPGCFLSCRQFAHLDPLEEAPGHFSHGTEGLPGVQKPHGGQALPAWLRAGVWSSSLQLRRAAMARAAERPRRGRNRISGVCWVPSAGERLRTRGKGAGEPPVFI